MSPEPQSFGAGVTKKMRRKFHKMMSLYRDMMMCVCGV